MKNYLLLTSLFILTLQSCKNENNDHALALKSKELELKERELNLKEKELEQSKKNESQSATSKKSLKKELRYVYYANGGLIAYFNDGTVTGCPRCDLMRSNLAAMFNDKPHATYTVQKDGSLLVNGTDRMYPSANASNGDHWALIDYKWIEKPVQDK
ncbi:MAG: hypothetical protein EOP48_17885 [Sphingobacteriales bacterium]|nr:MAG: hypothetical protein EOP48_17885 [Sphingobacteriales bacterium]